MMDEAAQIRRVLTPRSEILLMLALTLGYLPFQGGSDGVLWVVNALGPALFCAILGLHSYAMLRNARLVIWTPSFWFRIACMVYFGFGSLVPYLQNEQTERFVNNIHVFDQQTLAKLNLLYAFGLACALLFSRFFLRSRFGPDQSAPAPTSRTEHRYLSFGFAFLAVGGLMRYAVIVPNRFALEAEILSGAVIALEKLFYTGLLLVLMHGLKNRGSTLIACLGVMALDVIVAVASFSKTELLLVLLTAMLAIVSSGGSRMKLIGAAALIVSVFTTFQPLVMYGRYTLETRYGEITGAGLGERLDIVNDYLSGKGTAASDSDVQLALFRLSYLTTNAFVVEEYDAGRPGNTYRDAFAVFVPRALWADKPIITALGRELYQNMRRYESASYGVGHFAEAYWNFGWWGVAPVMAVLALILSTFTRFSIRVMTSGDYLFLPIVFLGLNVGLRVDGHFVPDIVGPAWTAVVFGGFLWAARNIAKGSRNRTRMHPAMEGI